MKSIYARAATLALTLAFGAAAAHAQRPPVLTDPSERPAAKPDPSAPKPAPPPASVQAKYEGGILGYKKQTGFLSFDEPNRRLLFKDKNQRELFSLSYDALLAAWPDTKSRASTAGQVIAGVVPYGLGLPALLMRSKTRYLVLQYRDPDTRAEGVTSFKLQTRELINSMLVAVAEKAGLDQRGDAYVRRTTTSTATGTP